MPALLCCVRRLSWLALATGLLFQIFFRDQWDAAAPFFYALPKPLLGLLALGLAVVSRRRQRWLAGSLAAGLWVWWLACSWCWNAPTQPAAPEHDRDVRLLFWNLSRPEAVHADLVGLVQKFQPHFAACVEPGDLDPGLLAAYDAALPGFQAAFMPRGILWLSRVTSRYRDRGKLDGLGAFAVFDVHDLGPVFQVVAVDVYAHPLLSRRRQMQEALDHAQGRPDAILLGDFNTPLESVHFIPYRRQLTDAFETAGRGFRETWPWGVPLLSLDHVWVGKDWQVIAADKVQTRASDHTALLVTLRRK